MTGKIDKMVRERGFGFIRADDGRQIFFHRINLLEVDFHALSEGQPVNFELQHGEFEVHRGQKGLRAAIVQVQPGFRPSSFGSTGNWARM